MLAEDAGKTGRPPRLRAGDADAMPDSRHELLDRHLAGELSRSEQQALAQTALEDTELFDLLTIIAAIK